MLIVASFVFEAENDGHTIVEDSDGATVGCVGADVGIEDGCVGAMVGTADGCVGMTVGTDDGDSDSNSKGPQLLRLTVY